MRISDWSSDVCSSDLAVVRSSRDRWGLRRAFNRAAVEIARRSATTVALSQIPWGKVNNGSAETHTDADRVDDAGHGQFLRQCARWPYPQAARSGRLRLRQSFCRKPRGATVSPTRHEIGKARCRE